MQGFTFVELIVATVILALAVAGVYAAFLSAARFIGFFRHDVMATILTDSLLRQGRAGYKFYDQDNTIPPYMVDDPNAGLDGTMPNFTSTPLEDQLNRETQSVTSGNYTVSHPYDDYGGGTHPYRFKRMDITINRQERQP